MPKRKKTAERIARCERQRLPVPNAGGSTVQDVRDLTEQEFASLCCVCYGLKGFYSFGKWNACAACAGSGVKSHV